MTENQIIEAAVENFSYNDNVDKFLEEASELQFALLKLKREIFKKNTDKRLEQVKQELADVKMSLNVLINLFGKEDINNYYKRNLTKLKNKVK